MPNPASGEKEPFVASMELLKSSPAGLVMCAAEWVASAKNHFDYEKGHAGLQAAARALADAPEIFVGAQGPSWEDSQRFVFWAGLFAARAQGAVEFDLLGALKPLSKAQLALGAKHMMILAAKSKDAESFESLLSLGAVRRSKLVMFSAYQNGGKTVAEKVKQPTASEAVELIMQGSRAGWVSSRAVSHDEDGLDWLLSKVDSFPTAGLAKVAAACADHEIALALLPKHESRLKLNLGAAEAKLGFDRTRIHLSAEQEGMEMALQFASAGAPQTAKACAALVAKKLGVDPVDFWKKTCSEGMRAPAHLPYPPLESPAGRYQRGEIMGGNIHAPMKAQAACALSGDEKACAWLRSEMESMGLRWAPAQELREFYKFLATGNTYQDQGLPELVARAVAASERADLFQDIAPTQAPKAKASRGRSGAL